MNVFRVWNDPLIPHFYTVYEIKYIHILKDGNDYSCTRRPLPCRQATIETGHDNSLRWKQLVAFIRKKWSSPTLQFRYFCSHLIDKRISLKERKLGILSNFFFIWVSFQRRLRSWSLPRIPAEDDCTIFYTVLPWDNLRLLFTVINYANRL